MKVLVVVDMQKDFIDGALGTPEAVGIVPRVIQKIQEFDGLVIATRDTHEEDYLDTQEGKKLPVRHCIRGTNGWEIRPEIQVLLSEKPIDKPTFGSVELVESVTLIGLCTDICVISNALLVKAYLPEVPVIVDSSCCAGVTQESHEQALNAMKMCQIEVV